MKKIMSALGLLAASTSALASTGVIDLQVRQGHRFSFGMISISGEAAEELYHMLTVQEVQMPDVRGDGIKYQTAKTADDLVCYRTVRQSRMHPGFPHREGPFQPGFNPVPGMPGPMMPPVPAMPGMARPFPGFGHEDRPSYNCQTRINSAGKIDIERGGHRDSDGE